MFEGVQDQLHQFLAAAAAAAPPQSPPPPLSFSLHASMSSSPLIFDNYPSSPPLRPPAVHYPEAEAAQIKLGSSVKQQGDNTSWFVRKSLDDVHPWSHDELVALFTVRSAIENCFPDFTWDHVSRKLEEIGFRRSPEKCKEKFEEGSRSYIQTATTNTSTSNINADEVMSCPTKNYRLFNELEELYHHSYGEVLDKEEKENYENQGQEGLSGENDGSAATDNHQQITIDEIEEDIEIDKKKEMTSHHNNKKKFKIFKSLCEEIVNKMMAHQEELHNKILQYLIKRDEEKIAMEETWKKQEMVRINKEMEARAKDQAVIGDRQAKIIEFLHKFISDSNNNNSSTNTKIITNNDDEFSLPILSAHQNPSSSATHSTSLNHHIPTSSNDESLSQPSNSLTNHINPMAPTSKIRLNSRKARPNKRAYENVDNHDDTGKRWPREEVTALINIRCNLNSTNNTRSDIIRDKSNKNPPLWERISKSMKELGYNRSAKRCKEKWENINKYFKKTKDSKKKRPVDSRTCPYFHQLNHLYSIGQISGGPNDNSDLSNSGDGDDDNGGATLNDSDQAELNGIHVVTSASEFEF